MEQFYRIAGLTVKMDTFGRTLEQARPYRTDPCRTADITVVSHREIVKQQLPGATDDMAEYLSSGADFYTKLLNFGGLMLHASAVVVDDRAYLFTADPGTGKSTHTDLWLRIFGPRAYILNDDKPALRLTGNGWYACGTPWSGKNDISTDISVPVAGIAFLERSTENEIFPMENKDAVRRIFAQTNRMSGMDYRIKMLELLDKLITQVPIWKLKCNMDPEAAVVSYEAMSGCKYKEN